MYVCIYIYTNVYIYIYTYTHIASYLSCDFGGSPPGGDFGGVGAYMMLYVYNTICNTIYIYI